ARREELLRRHAEYFLAFAEHGDRQDPKELVPLIDRLDAEQANLRAALQGARELGDGVLELRLVVAISPLCSVRSMSRGPERMRRALDEGAAAPLAVRLDGMRQAVMWADKQGKVELARALSDELLVLCGDDEVELARAFNTLGVLALTERRFDEARHYL